MTIIFNGYAVIQGIILGIIVVTLNYLQFPGYLNEHGVSDNMTTAIMCYSGFCIVAPMDLRGIKGRFFFLPTWFIFLVVPLFFTYRHLEPGLYWFARLFSFSMFIYFMYCINKRFNQSFEKAQQAVQQMHGLPTETANDRKRFWALASHAYFKPSLFYLYLNPVFRALWRNSVTLEQFTGHYRRLIPLIKPQVRNTDQLKKLEEFETALNKPKYSHETHTLKNIADIIDEKNKALR